MYPLISLLILVLDIYVIYLVIKGPGDAVKKLVWVVVVLFLPVVGPLLYLLLGRGR
jgi:Phospholipase_D-nuclease N-terminal